jgi:hypothetical protein
MDNLLLEIGGKELYFDIDRLSDGRIFITDRYN